MVRDHYLPSTYKGLSFASVRDMENLGLRETSSQIVINSDNMGRKIKERSPRWLQHGIKGLYDLIEMGLTMDPS